ncbi:hypothetical protein [Piscinibacter gummiphilus]|uniref:Uncharacterized protein n=1 Tax=Piscinibacter gummiphilus TaxID=946333 RepID=A0ABZ0CNB4_9BURK|nr:hypothetical protein [Piscinibacter gummiphilus]WOB06455.1 hypothetical protein RXV79_16155 [Piscinibacter gummiphilus]
MPWAVAAAVIGVAGSAAVSRSNQKKAEEAQKKQQAGIDRQQQLAEEQLARYYDLYGGLEEGLAQENRDFDSEANKTKAAEEAAATVTSTFSNLRQKLNSTPGLDPSSDRYQKMLVKLGIQEAGQSAAAQTGARRQIEQDGQARKLNTLSLGKGLPAQAAAGMAAATNGYGQLASQYGAQAARDSYGFGRMVGDVLNNKTFQDNVSSWFKKNPEIQITDSSANNNVSIYPYQEQQAPALQLEEFNP